MFMGFFLLGVDLGYLRNLDLGTSSPLIVFLSPKFPATWKTTSPSGSLNPGAARDPTSARVLRKASTVTVQNGPR